MITFGICLNATDELKKFRDIRAPKQTVQYKKSIKKSENLASKSVEFANQEYTRPVKLFFQDKARFGRIDNICFC